jgi:hypothetical protein
MRECARNSRWRVLSHRSTTPSRSSGFAPVRGPGGGIRRSLVAPEVPDVVVNRIGMLMPTGVNYLKIPTGVNYLNDRAP